MLILDANMILRFLLKDNEEMAQEAKRHIESGNAYVTIEVIAEVIYVLNGFYGLERKKIVETLSRFLSLVGCQHAQSLELALDTYANENLDFVDCMLYAYNRIDGAQIATFDKKLLKLIERQ